jgi:hypothetical protein
MVAIETIARSHRSECRSLQSDACGSDGVFGWMSIVQPEAMAVETQVCFSHVPHLREEMPAHRAPRIEQESPPWGQSWGVGIIDNDVSKLSCLQQLK